MRLAVIGPIFPDSFAKCILHTLRDMGHEVLSVNPEKGGLAGYLPDSLYTRNFLKIKSIEMHLVKLYPSIERAQWETTVVAIKRFSPDIILSVLWDIPIDILTTMKELPGKNIITAVWSADALSNFYRQYIFAAPWDFLFFKDQYIIDFLRQKLQLNAYLLPLGCYPGWHRQVELTPDEREVYGCDLTIAGGLYYYRAKLFEQFLQYNIKIWGPPPPAYVQSPVTKCHQGRYVGEWEKAKAFNGAAIVLNNMHYAEIMGLNQRVFDACGCGAFQITDASPVMAEFFNPGKELVCFKDLAELQELIPYYLNRPKERAKIAMAGYRRAHAEHTFRHRLEKMLAIISGDKSS
jgi:spore maturation protein CgeB